MEKYAIVFVVLNICTWSRGSRWRGCLQQLPFGISDDGSRVDAILDAIWTDHKVDRHHRSRKIKQGKCHPYASWVQSR